MKPLLRAPAVALVALVAAVCPRAALAAEPSCPGPIIAGTADLEARFSDLVESLRREFSARSDLDACARVGLRLETDETIALSVTLPDGRATSRTVTRSDDVIPTLQALLIVPLSPPPPSAALERRARTSLPRAPTPQLSLRSEGNGTLATADAASRPGLELSAITGVRLGDGQFAAGVGALSFFRIHGWLLGFQGRADSYRRLLGGDPETALELALLTGRRFELGAVTLDLTAGPGIAMQGFAFGEATLETTRMSMSTDSAAPPAPSPRDALQTGPLPRLLLAARIGFNPRSVLRTFFGFDGEFGPPRQANGASPSSARLPSYSLGLAVGATIGTP